MQIAQTDNDEEMIVEGYAAVFNQETVLYEQRGTQYKEIIAFGAFDGADMEDVCFKYNHRDSGMLMAHTRNKTLILGIDGKGLTVRANLAPTTAGKDLYTLIRRGDISQMSFAFNVQSDKYDRMTHTRTIVKFKKIHEVSAVDASAYPQTSICARSYFDAKLEEENLLCLEFETRKKRIVIATYL